MPTASASSLPLQIPPPKVYHDFQEHFHFPSPTTINCCVSFVGKQLQREVWRHNLMLKYLIRLFIRALLTLRMHNAQPWYCYSIARLSYAKLSWTLNQDLYRVSGLNFTASAVISRKTWCWQDFILWTIMLWICAANFFRKLWHTLSDLKKSMFENIQKSLCKFPASVAFASSAFASDLAIYSFALLLTKVWQLSPKSCFGLWQQIFEVDCINPGCNYKISFCQPTCNKMTFGKQDASNRACHGQKTSNSLHIMLSLFVTQKSSHAWALWRMHTVLKSRG